MAKFHVMLSLFLCLNPAALTPIQLDAEVVSTIPTVAFQYLGETVHTLGYVHLHLYLNTSEYRDVVNQAIDLIQGYWRDTLDSPPLRAEFSIYQIPGRTRPASEITDLGLNDNTSLSANWARELFSQQVTELQLCHDQLDSNEGLAQQAQDRVRRFVSQLLGIAWNTFMGLYNKLEMSRLEERVDRKLDAMVVDIGQVKLQQAVNILAIQSHEDAIRTYSLRLFNLETNARRTAIAGNVVRQITRATDHTSQIVQALLMHRVSPLILPRKHMRKILRAATAKARAQGYELLADTVASIYQCEASFAVDKDGGLSIYVHVPMAREEDRLKLYKHLPIPMRSSTHSLVTVLPTKNLIAIDPANTKFKVMTSADLTTCKLVGGVFVCKDSNVVRLAAPLQAHDDTDKRAEPDLCIFYLYRKMMSDIPKVCPAIIDSPKDDAIAVSGREFFVMSRAPELGRLFCPGRSEAPLDLAVVSKVTLEPGCSLVTKSHTVTASLDIASEILTFEYNWDGGVKAILGKLTKDQVEEIGIRKMQAEIKESPSYLSDIQARMDDDAQHNWEMAQLMKLQRAQELLAGNHNVTALPVIIGNNSDFIDTQDAEKAERTVNRIAWGLLLVTALALVIASILIYRHSSRVRSRVKHLFSKVKDITALLPQLVSTVLTGDTAARMAALAKDANINDTMAV